MPPRNDINIQDGYLFGSLKENRPLDVYLTSGREYKGALLIRFDRFAVIFDTGDRERLIYKHAIEEIADVEGAPARSANRPVGGGARRAPNDRSRHRTAHWG